MFVREIVDGATVVNQPAGHLEFGETLLEAVVREVREETRRAFTPRAVTGLYRWQAASGLTFMRVNFCGDAGDELVELERDADILDTVWLDRESLLTENARSPLVLRCVDDLLAQRCYPLEVLHDLT